MLDFLKRPDLYIYQKLRLMDVAENVSIGNIVASLTDVEFKEHCSGKLLNNKLEKSMLDILSVYRGKTYSFSTF